MSEIKPIKRLIPLLSLLILFSIGPILFSQGAPVTQITPHASDVGVIPTPVYPFPTEKQKLVRSYIVSSDVFFHKGDYDSAIAEIRKALAVDPDDHQAQTELATYSKIKEDSKNWLWRFNRWFWEAVNYAFFSIWFYILPPLAALLLGFYYSIKKHNRKHEGSDTSVKSGNEKKSGIALWDSAKRNKIWMFVNLLSLILYLLVSKLSWPELTNEGYIVTGNMAIGWGFTALPILVLMLLANVVWISFSLGRRNWPDFLLAILVLFFWIYLHPIENWIWFDLLKAHEL